MALHTNSPRPRRKNGLAPLRNERGSVLALVVLCLIVFLGLAALAIDLGLLYVARGEAQRAADAAAHGGAAHLLHNPGVNDTEIKEAAIRAGERNLIRGQMGDITLTDVEISPERDKVSAWVYRTAERANPVRTLFASVLGFQTTNVAAYAAAELWPAEASQCVWPFAIPDQWCTQEAMANGKCPLGGYSNPLDGTERWDEGDWYRSYRFPIEVTENGQTSEYWTGYSDDDYGRQLLIKPQSPQGAIQPGWFFPFQDGSGGAGYREAIHSCGSGDNVFAVGETLTTEPGNMVGPTRQGFERLKSKYPDARWNPTLNCTDTANPKCGGPVGDPGDIAQRTRPVVLIDPENPPEQGRKDFLIEGFAAVFFDDFDANGDVRVYFVTLTGEKPAAIKNPDGGNPQLKIIRNVE